MWKSGRQLARAYFTWDNTWTLYNACSPTFYWPAKCTHAHVKCAPCMGHIRQKKYSFKIGYKIFTKGRCFHVLARYCVYGVAILQWRTVAIFVGCSPGSQPAQKCEGSPAVVVVAYHKPFKHLNRLTVDHNNQTTRRAYARTSTVSGTNNN